MCLLEYLFIPLWYIFNSVNKQTVRIIHTTAKSAAMVVAEMVQAEKLVVARCTQTCNKQFIIVAKWAHNFMTYPE